jgi:uncharacterized RDD family membrane protein YckC
MKATSPRSLVVALALAGCSLRAWASGGDYMGLLVLVWAAPVGLVCGLVAGMAEARFGRGYCLALFLVLCGMSVTLLMLGGPQKVRLRDVGEMLGLTLTLGAV